MRPGTPKFNGSRLRSAREARGLSGAALAELVNVSRSAISQYERGVQTPSPQNVQEIANKLNLPPKYFLQQSIQSNQTAVFYRSFSAALKSARTRSQRKLDWLHEIVDHLEQLIELPNVNLPEIELPDDVLSVTSDEIENIAKKTRRFWGLGDGPISNMVQLLENNGIIVSRQFLDSLKLDAFSNWNVESHRPFVVLGSDKGSAVRSRFDAAHELAHLILHKDLAEKDLKNASIFKAIERQANEFAGAFLLPSTTFLSEVFSFTPEGLLTLKKRWGVSVGLMVKRSSDLGAIDDDSTRKLWMRISKRGWRKKEPYDDEILPESPNILSKCFQLLIDSGIGVRDSILARLPWHWRDIEEIASLRTGLLSPPNDEVASQENQPRIIKFPNLG